MRKIDYSWKILIACCLLQTGVSILSYTNGIFYAPIAAELGVGRGNIALYATIQGIAMSITFLFSGKIIARKGIQWILALFAVIVAIVYCFMSRFDFLWQWYLTGIINGICFGFLVVIPTPILINNWFKEKVGLALGISSMFTGIGGVIGTQIGTFVIVNYGWRLAYIVLGLISVVVMVPISLLLIRYSPEEKGTVAFGEKLDQNAPSNNSTSAKEVDRKNVIKSKSFLSLYLAAILMAFMAAFIPHLPGFADSIGMSEYFGAQLASAGLIGVVISKPLYGYLKDKIGTLKSSNIAIIIIAIAFAFISLVFGNKLLLIMCSFVLGLASTVYAMTPPWLVKDMYGSKNFGRIYSIVSSATLFSSISASAIAFVYDFSGSYIPAFIAGIIAAAGSLIFIRFALSVSSKEVI